MMNLVALCLVVTSLATAGVFSPTTIQHDQNQREDVVIVKEGHRVVVVEYEDEGNHKTKISISPEDQDNGNTEEKARDGEQHSSRELICEAFGKCKHKIASAMGKAKEVVSDIEEHTKESVEKAGESVLGKVLDIKEHTKESIDSAKEMGKRVGEDNATSVSDKVEKAKEQAAEKSRDAQEATKRAMDKAKTGKDRLKEETSEGLGKIVHGGEKGSVRSAEDIGIKIRDDIVRNVTEAVESMGEQVIEKGKEAKETAKHAADKGLTATLGGGSKFLRYLTSQEFLSGLMIVFSLLGFATAFGMNVWVTFISSYVLAGAIPRQQFAMVQSKIYPIYFKAMAISVGMALLGYVLSHTKWLFSNEAEILQGYVLLVAFLTVFANSIYLEPRANKVMFEMLKLEKEEGRGREEVTTAETNQVADPSLSGSEGGRGEPVGVRLAGLNQKLKKLNSYSSILNILTLMALGWHLIYLSKRFRVCC